MNIAPWSSWSTRQSVTLKIAGSSPVGAAKSHLLGEGYFLKSFPLVKTPAAAGNKSMERSGPRRNPTDRVCNAAGSLHILRYVPSTS